MNSRTNRRPIRLSSSSMSVSAATELPCLFLILMLLLLLTLPSATIVVSAWISVKNNRSPSVLNQPYYTGKSSYVVRNGGPFNLVPPTIAPSRTRMHLSSSSNSNSNDDDDDSAVLSELDARVLQSFLQEDKLDLKQEKNMKKLLERGIASKKSPTVPVTPKEEEDSKSDSTTYSSTVIKTLADTKLWKALKRNVQDLVESSRIALANRIERDAKLIASLGIFALERGIRDVSRALPASVGIKTKQKIFQLSDKSSFDDSDDSNKQSSSSSSARDLRKEFSTPQDEIRAVSVEIRQIFQAADRKETRDVPSPGTYTLPTASSSLRNTARRGKARLSQAYAKQQKTKLAQEKENLAQSSTRVASKLIDSAYQVQRELQVEPNQPGYKSKALLEATVTATKQLASAAGAGAEFLLGSVVKKDDSEKQKPLFNLGSPEVSSSVTDVIDEVTGTNGSSSATVSQPPMTSTPSSDSTYTTKPVDDVDEEPYFAFKRGGPSSKEWTEPYSFLDDSLLPEQPAETQDIPFTTKTVDIVDVVSRYEEVAVGVRAQGKTTTQSKSYSSTYPDLVDDFIVAEVLPSSAFRMPTTSTDAGDTAMDAYARAFESASANFVDGRSAVLEQPDVDDLRLVTAEIISDDDFEGAVGQAKMVENLSPEELIALQEQQELEESNEPPNLLTKLTLRSLDVVFLIVEKAVLFIPDVLAVSTRVATRLADVGRDGMGQRSWQRINTKRGDKRY